MDIVRKLCILLLYATHVGISSAETSTELLLTSSTGACAVGLGLRSTTDCDSGRGTKSTERSNLKEMTTIVVSPANSTGQTTTSATRTTVDSEPQLDVCLSQICVCKSDMVHCSKKATLTMIPNFLMTESSAHNITEM